MHIKSHKDFACGLIFVVSGASFAWGYRFGSDPGVLLSPGDFSSALGTLLAVLGALLLFKALTIEAAGGGRIGGIAWRPLLLVAGGVALFGWTLPRLGLVVALPLLVLTSALASEDFRWKEVMAACVVLTLAAWGIFIVGLKLKLPLWPT